ncbi:MAG: hypothetical protein K0R14_772 [Burkholderiales bacterium]|jgi:Zn-dependent peptidase ImmA (M78 family)|nr:hypothetical protein [Burkholderiales bacterium]
MVKSVKELFPIIDDYAELIIVKELEELKAPVNIEQIVKNYGIQVYKESMEENQSGAIVINDNASGMIINKDDSLSRQRFTMAHELGHFISYKLQNKTGEIIEFRDGTSSLGTNLEEIFANKFAASILIPKTLLVSLIGSMEVNIEELSNIFEVSQQSLEFRIKNLL